jgi:WbqC-like protein family
MAKKVAVVQSNYIPWKGYFDLINSVDEFILFDDVQYTKRDWRNRNLIKTPSGPIWLTIPAAVKGKYHQKICDTLVSEPQWGLQHWKTIMQWYAKAPHFSTYREIFEALYLGMNEDHLSKINYGFIKRICELLGIRTKLSWSSSYEIIEGKTERLVHLCKLAEASEYISGPSAQAYLDTKQFESSGITVRYMSYEGYPTYSQLYPPFEHAVSIVDLLFSEGPDSPKYMLSFPESYASSSLASPKPVLPYPFPL